MVHKTTKKGVQSGNTFRTANTRYYKSYSRQACVIRHTESANRGVSDAVDTDTSECFKISTDDVAFSLNKRGRWAVPSLLKNHILHNDHSEEKCNLKVIERHKLKRSANCVGFCATKGNIKSVNSKSTYFNIKSISENPTPGAGRRQKIRRRPMPVIENDESEELTVSEPEPEVCYEFFYPAPSTNSLVYTRNNIMSPSSYETDDSVKRGRRQRRRKQLKYAHDYLDDLDYYEEDEWQGEEGVNIYEQTTRTQVELSNLIENEVLNHTRNAQTHQSKSKALSKISMHPEERQRYDTKSRIIYTQEVASIAEQTSEEKTTNDHPTSLPTENKMPVVSEPVYVVLNTDEVICENLAGKYGKRYMECQCHPRKFLVNISEDIVKYARNSRLFKMSKVNTIDFSSCLVFVCDAEDSFEEIPQCVYKVHLNIKLTINSFKIETLFDYMPTNIDEIILKACFFLETLPIENFVNKEDRIWSTIKPRFNMATLQSYPNLSAEIVDPMCSLESVFNNNAPSNDCLNRQTGPRDFCFICYESLESGHARSINATALIGCGHWFCDECWRAHLESGIRNGVTSLLCPEYECDQKISTDVLLSLLNVGTIELYKRRVQTKSVDCNTEQKWCPSPRCGRIWKAPDSVHKSGSSISVNCECGRVTCFECLQTAHWPASCAHVASYTQKMETLGDDKAIPSDLVKPLVVRGKKCPHCHQFMEKNGGCYYMGCVCGKAFCWGCSKPWENHVFNVDTCSQTRGGDLARTREESLYHSDPSEIRKGRSKFYRIALENRMARHPQKMKIMRSHIFAITRKIANNEKSHGKKVVEDLENYTIPREVDPTISIKVSHFLSSMADLNLELHHVAEYTAVLLEYNTDDMALASYIKRLVERMGELARSIYTIMYCGCDQDTKKIIHRLWRLRLHSKKAIGHLVAVLPSRMKARQFVW